MILKENQKLGNRRDYVNPKNIFKWKGKQICVLAAHEKVTYNE